MIGALSPVSISWTRSRAGGNLFGSLSINTSLYSWSVLCNFRSCTVSCVDSDSNSDFDFDFDFAFDFDFTFDVASDRDCDCDSDSCSTFRTKYSAASMPGYSITFTGSLSEMVLHPKSGSPSILPKCQGYGTSQYCFPSLVISIIMLSQCVNALYCLCQFNPRTRSKSASKSITTASTCPCHPNICTGSWHFPYTIIFWPPARLTCLSTSNFSIITPAL